MVFEGRHRVGCVFSQQQYSILKLKTIDHDLPGSKGEIYKWQLHGSQRALMDGTGI
jgi:hypothetical protein